MSPAPGSHAAQLSSARGGGESTAPPSGSGKEETETLPATSASKVGTASVIWAIPELAFVGQTEQDAKEAYGEEAVLAIHVPFSETIRGSLSSLPSSHFLKLVCLRQDGRIVGVHLYGEGRPS